ncbi:MAG: DUF2177 family protein [Gemmatimonadales bacterium]|nr:DUF2177 family protein [Gemmatimonadales bacterium]NIN12963.1 DUF2177 family protein [Gemmatimonadales bacterium]NIR02638.1 DUF2177 family protein [Gemmatimonadales bacterium]NIS67214.1 DUF2177 family protein [Gemmatimonadales bacterium]
MALADFLKLHAVGIVTFLVVDLVWLGVVARGFYRSHMGPLLREDIQWVPAIVFYLLFTGCLILFAVMPAMERSSPWRAILLGGLFGCAAYATYDLTNLATLRGFPTLVAIVDIVWGTVLAAIVAAVTYQVGRLVT